VIDDTGCPKPYAEKTDAARVQYCPPLGKPARCNVTVLSTFAAPNRYFPLDIRPYRPAQDFDAGRDDPRFRSKIQLAQELIDHAEAARIRFSDIVFDSWYAANSLLNILPSSSSLWSRARGTRAIPTKSTSTPRTIAAWPPRRSCAEAHGPPCLGDALRLHRWNQEFINLKWIRRYPHVYHVIFVTQPFMNVTARVA